MNHNKFFFICIVIFIASSSHLFSQKSVPIAPAPNDVAEKFGLFEAEFVADSTYDNPYVEVSFSAHVAGPESISFDVEGYWAGSDKWKLRIMPTEVGGWNYTTYSNDPGLDSLSGSFDCVASLRKGILIVNPDYPQTFKLSEGQPFLWMGETSWCLMSDAALFSDGTFQTYINKRAEQKFNMIHFVLGTGGLPYGTHNPGNEGGSLWISRSQQRINPEFFSWMDKRMAYLDSMQMAVGFFITWSQHFITFTRDQFERLERYLIARYAAYPLLFWVIVGEFDEAGALAEYNYHGNVIKDRDPYGHLISNHPANHDLKNPGTSRIFAGQEWFHIILQQLPKYPVLGTPEEVNQFILRDRKHNLPVVNNEFGYEGRDYDGRLMTSDYVRKYAWSIFLGGGFFSYGHEKTIRQLDLSSMEAEGVTYLSHLYDFFRDLNWWQMNPDTQKVDKGFCLGNPLSMYVIYLPDSGAVNVDLVPDTGFLMASWYDPKSGVHGDTVLIRGGAMESFNSPYSDDAVLHLFPNVKPIIQVEPDSLFFEGQEKGDNPPVQVIRLTNRGGGTMNWFATTQRGVPWLSLHPAKGSSGGQIIVSIDITNQVAGTYLDTICISDFRALNSPVTVPVILRVYAPANIVNDPICLKNLSFPGIPEHFALFQNQPNPFNQSTTIHFDLPHGAIVELYIYNVLGQKVTTLLNCALPASSYQIDWNGIDDLGMPLNSGIYFYQIKVKPHDTDRRKSFSARKKMLLVK